MHACMHAYAREPQKGDAIAALGFRTVKISRNSNGALHPGLEYRLSQFSNSVQWQVCVLVVYF